MANTRTEQPKLAAIMFTDMVGYPVLANRSDALVWSQEMPAEEVGSTLALAMTNESYWQFALTPSTGQPLNLRKAEVRFSLRRIDYHSPRQYAVFTSVGGFTNGAQAFDTGYFTDDTDREFVFTLPETAAFSNLANLLTFRLFGYSGQFAGHKTSLRAFKLSVPVVESPAISLQPQSQSVNPGSPVTFSVVAAGTAPLSYLWRDCSGLQQNGRGAWPKRTKEDERNKTKIPAIFFRLFSFLSATLRSLSQERSVKKRGAFFCVNASGRLSSVPP